MKPWHNTTDDSTSRASNFLGPHPASMKPWHNTTDDAALEQLERAETSGFNETVAQHHGRQSTGLTIPDRAGHCFNETVAQHHGRRLPRLAKLS